MEIIKLSLITALASIIPGQTLRFELGGQGAITLTDIFVALTGFLFILHSLLIKKSLKIPQKIFFPALLFTLASLTSLYLSLTDFTLREILISSFFLIRFFIYFFLAVVVYNVVKKEQILGWIHAFLLIGFIFTVIGFFQFVTFSDLSSLTSQGWDPHQKRIVSSLIDPNFSGLIFAFLAAFSSSLYLFKKNKIYLLMSIISYIALVLTFSRSSYLAAVAIILTIGLLKSPKLLILSLFIFSLSFFALPQMRSRIMGALTLDETSQARLQSWQNAIRIFLDQPLFGVGFNTYRYAQAKYGFFPPGELGGHSGSGSDSSFLLTLATTGIFGTSFFVFLLISIFNTFKKRVNISYLKLASLSSLIGLSIHSQFVNSIFFPQIMVIFWLIAGLNLRDDL